MRQRFRRSSFTGNTGTFAPHPALRATFPRRGRLFSHKQKITPPRQELHPDGAGFSRYSTKIAGKKFKANYLRRLPLPPLRVLVLAAAVLTASTAFSAAGLAASTAFSTTGSAALTAFSTTGFAASTVFSTTGSAALTAFSTTGLAALTAFSAAGLAALTAFSAAGLAALTASRRQAQQP